MKALPIRQTSVDDCGLACLAMILRAHGVAVSLEELQRSAPEASLGQSARQLITMAGRFGVVGRLVRCSPEELRSLPTPAVLHWRQAHFVVLEGVGADSIRIIDPASGRRELAPVAVRSIFSGSALVFPPTT